MKGSRTKLVCTIGPASAGRIPALVAAGMDVARINFSHGTDADHTAAARAVRDTDPSVALLVDLPGPKIRLGDFDGERQLRAGAGFELRPGEGLGDATGASVSYSLLASDVRPGDRILLADGAVELRVTAVGDAVETEVVRGGTVRAHAGVSIPAHRLSEPALTDADRAAIPRARALGADWIAQSFVRRASDVEELRAVLGREGAPIVAKIETGAAVDDFDAICGVADAVMVARGDLGVELPYEEVPILQKQLIRRALDLGVPSIVATQMLESMTAAPRPTRAEASDVANAIFDGADAVMLSAETAIGSYPVLAAESIGRIAALCEERGAAYLPAGRPPSSHTDADALAFAAVALASANAEVGAIVCFTRTGRTARVVSALRPRVPIHAFSPEPAVLRRLALLHGVVARGCPPPAPDEDRLTMLEGLTAADPELAPGSAVVLVASSAQPGSGPNLLSVHRVAR